MRVLLSIRPDHVENILMGIKTFEFRRRIFKRPGVRSVLIYCTMPVGRIVGEFDIAQILEDEPSRLWRSTKHGSGITKAYYDAYFQGRRRAYALQVANLKIFEEPVIPAEFIKDFTPPQSYRYVCMDAFANDRQPLLI